VPETPEQLWARASGALRMPPVEGWDTFPFDGELRPRPLAPPVETEAPRHGVGGIGCERCARPDEEYLWVDDNWRLSAPDDPPGLPMIALLETRAHRDFHELPPELAAELGPLLIRVQRAIHGIGEIGNVHVCRWGDGSEHFHFWFLARPARLPQLIGSFAAIWDDVLPPTPEDVWRENLAAVAAALDA
jgi:hypothetical protein